MYDNTLGSPFFVGTRRDLKSFVRRYGINFRSAAAIGCGTGRFACDVSRCWRGPVFAVDISPEALREACATAAMASVCLSAPGHPQLRLPHPRRVGDRQIRIPRTHLVAVADLWLASGASTKICGWWSFYFDLITPCQPLGGRRAYVRRFGAAEGDADQEPEPVAKGASRPAVGIPGASGTTFT